MLIANDWFGITHDTITPTYCAVGASISGMKNRKVPAFVSV